jgi:hypothetical protein
MKPTVGCIVHCWPPKHDAPTEAPLVCAAIVVGVFDEEIRVHYFLPDGANGACPLPLEPATEPARGAWWWPPRQ